MTLRCYVEDVARFLGRNGEVFVFDTPDDLARFIKGNEEHDLLEIASWAEVADTDVPPLPADQDRYDLTELSEVLPEVADGATGADAADWGGQDHLDGGSHGSLHRSDSLGALMWSGLGPDSADARPLWTLQDLVPMVREHFGLTPA